MYTKTILASLAATVLLAAGAASAQTTSAFTVNAVPVPLAAPGLSDAILAIITFDATHASSSITVKSAPIQASFNGVSQSNFTNCRLVNIGNLQFLTGTSSASLASSPTINLDTPLVVPAGATARTFLLCATAPSTTAVEKK